MQKNFYQFRSQFNKKYYSECQKEISIIPSKDINTNKMLFALKIIEDFPGINSLPKESKYLSLGLQIGSKTRSSYLENNKGEILSEVIDFINRTLGGFDLKLEHKSKRAMNNLMGEILGNAEDHSSLSNFYVNGASFLEIVDDQPLIELNLSIINFGDSIANGFEKTKRDNQEIYRKMHKLFERHSRLLNGNFNNHYSRESLYTLYSLQEGVSRIKFLRKSRGNGTMNFIRAFINLGSYGDINKKYQSSLNVISGNSVIECNNKYKPYKVTNKEDGRMKYILSLNKERDLEKLPDKNHIFANKKAFPGTVLQVKIFMDKKHFMTTLDEDNE